jgi:hypothetical protein
MPAGRIGPLPDASPDASPDACADACADAMNPGIHGVRTQWIRGFMTFQLARRTRILMLVRPV